MNSTVEKVAYASTFVLAFGWIVLVALMVGAATLFGEESPLLDVAAITLGVYFLCVFLSPIIYSVFGVWIERIHYKNLEREEKEFADIMISDMKTLPPNWNASKTFFVCENVVISNDYLKRFFWMFRKIFGGRSRSFERLIERARREATLRILRRAREFGANAVWNVRFETTIVYSNSSNSSDGRSGAGVEVLAYGTAFLVE